MIILFGLPACVPDNTDRADFYALCSEHVKGYMKPGEKVVTFEAAQNNPDFIYWKNKQRASITTIVRSSDPTAGDNAQADHQIRNCSFKVARNGWAVE